MKQAIIVTLTLAACAMASAADTAKVRFAHARDRLHAPTASAVEEQLALEDGIAALQDAAVGWFGSGATVPPSALDSDSILGDPAVAALLRLSATTGLAILTPGWAGKSRAAEVRLELYERAQGGAFNPVARASIEDERTAFPSPLPDGLRLHSLPNGTVVAFARHRHFAVLSFWSVVKRTLRMIASRRYECDPLYSDVEAWMDSGRLLVRRPVRLDLSLKPTCPLPLSVVEAPSLDGNNQVVSETVRVDNPWLEAFATTLAVRNVDPALADQLPPAGGCVTNWRSALSDVQVVTYQFNDHKGPHAVDCRMRSSGSGWRLESIEPGKLNPNF